MQLFLWKKAPGLPYFWSRGNMIIHASLFQERCLQYSSTKALSEISQRKKVLARSCPDHATGLKDSPLIWPCFCAPPCYPPFWMLSSVSSCMLCIPWFNTWVSIKKKYSAAIILDKTTPLTLCWGARGHLLLPISFVGSKATTSFSLCSATWIILHQGRRTFPHKWDTRSPTSSWQAMVISPWIITTGGKWRNCSRVTWTTRVD